MRGVVRVSLAVAGSLLLALAAAGAGLGRQMGGTPVALVTAETSNALLAVRLPDGKVLRRIRLDDPQTVAAAVSGPAVVVSPKGTVTLLAWRSLRRLAVLHGFRSPQLAAIAPDGEWAYVTDAATGEVSVIELGARRVVDRVLAGVGAHHLAISSDGTRAWVALGESTTTIVVLDTSHPRRVRVIGRVHPPVPAHDLAFAPDGRTVWVGSASAPYVSVLDVRSGKLLARIPAGAAPQHVAFIPYGRPRAFITSGYGSSLEEVDAHTRRILHRVALPYGSFNLATAGDILATASLLDGRVSEFNGETLARWMTARLAPATRDLAISVWP